MAWQCVKCGSTELTVVVEIQADLHQDGDDFETDIDGGDHLWGDDSSMACKACGHADTAKTFSFDS